MLQYNWVSHRNIFHTLFKFWKVWIPIPHRVRRRFFRVAAMYFISRMNGSGAFAVYGSKLFIQANLNLSKKLAVLILENTSKESKLCQLHSSRNCFTQNGHFGAGCKGWGTTDTVLIIYFLTLYASIYHAD